MTGHNSARASVVRGVYVFAIAAILGSVQHIGVADAAPPPTREPLVTTAARKVGVKRCLPAVAAIAQRGMRGATQQDILIDWDRQAPDSAPFFSLTGFGAGTQRAALTIAAFPVAGGGCSILVERISSTAQSCTAVAASELPQFPGSPLIDGIMVYQNPSQPGETYTLINSHGGCLVIRRQAALKWPPRP